MGNKLNDDFVDFINALNSATVEYMLVGGYAVIYHGYNRTTGDIDIWVNPTAENYEKLKLAFFNFGMSLFDMTFERFSNTASTDVYTFGRPPVCIEILTSISGLTFNSAYKNALRTNWEGVFVQIIDIRDLKINKKASGRNKDLDDLDHLD
jgi:hypothetical protein